MKKLLIVCGPTATGKTALAFSLAKKFDGELVSADSRQIYRGLDIVTGKDLPSKEKINHVTVTATIRDKTFVLHPYNFSGIPLWLYDVVNPDEAFSVYQYRSLAATVVTAISKTHALPIVVGGTGLYIKSLLEPLSSVEVPRDDEFRQRLADASVQKLQKELENIDNMRLQAMNASDRANPRRLLRAIEIVDWKKRQAILAPRRETLHDYNVLIIGLTAPFDELTKRIRERVIACWEQGAVEEVRTYMSSHPHLLQSSTALGLDILANYTNNKLTEEQTIEQWIQKDREYAKSQLTWFKKQNNIHWFDIRRPDYQKTIVDCVSAWYT